MPASQTIPWSEIHELLLAVGAVREPRAFCVRAVRELARLVPYDQARLYFIDATGHIEDEVLLGADPAWSERYVDHFAGLDHGLYSIAGRRRALLQRRIEQGHYVMPGIEGGFYDWEEHRRDEFVADYVLAQGIRHSAGFAFHDPIGRIACVYALDRTTHGGFTALEAETLRRVQPHLDNLHRNLLVDAVGRPRHRRRGRRGAVGPRARGGDARAPRHDARGHRPRAVDQPPDGVPARREHPREARRVEPPGAACSGSRGCGQQRSARTPERYFLIIRRAPPSTTTVAPCMKSLTGVASMNTTRATSSGSVIGRLPGLAHGLPELGREVDRRVHGARGHHAAGQHAVDRDPEGLELARQRLRDPDHAGLRGNVRDEHPVAALHRDARDGRDVDDPAAPALLDHAPGDRLGEEHGALEARIHHVVPRRLGQVEELDDAPDRRVVHQDVDAAERLHRRVDGALDRDEVADVGDLEPHVAALAS